IDSCTSRCTRAARAARATAADASVRKRSFSAQAARSAMRSVLGMCVSRLMTTSAPSNARRSAASSKTSASTVAAPRLSIRSRPRAERVTPVTRWPAARSSRTARRPMTPVDPVTTISLMPGRRHCHSAPGVASLGHRLGPHTEETRGPEARPWQTFRPDRRKPHMRPTIVLVHGAFAESASWDRVIDPLAAEGHRVIAAANPLRSLAGDAAAVSDLVRTIEGPVVLVGHSYGGAVISNVDPDAGDIAGVVYVNGFAPDAGESCFQLAAMFPGSMLGQALQPVPRSDGTTDLYIKPSRFHGQFAADVPA